ncbi:MAG: hypothetical protein R3322_00215 [Kiloniellales bacterium]|nr:hypothetical protein [Kiloniellales bacterium]
MKESIEARFKDGAIVLTWLAGESRALLTVRGKVHDLSGRELEELADALLEAAAAIRLTRLHDEFEGIAGHRP